MLVSDPAHARQSIMPLILKRLTVWLLEALLSTLLFGVLFGALSSPDLSTFASILPGTWALALGVGAICFCMDIT